VIVEREFLTDMVHQGYIEPQNATVLWNADGVVTIWCSNQGAFGVRDQTARILGIPVSQIKVVPPGDWRGIRREDQSVFGTDCRAVVEKDRASGKNDYDPH